MIQAAAVTAEGPVSFTVGRGTNGQVTDALQDGAASVAGRDAFALLGELDLLKIDIEGGEWAILADPRAVALQVPVVMLEYHAQAAPSADPAADAKSALERAGYATESAGETRPGFGVMWGYKPPHAGGLNQRSCATSASKRSRCSTPALDSLTDRAPRPSHD